MLGKISRLFGGQQQQHTGNRERECSSKRQDGDGWDASSSKKVRVEAVEMVCKPGGNGTDQTDDQEVVFIKEELTEAANKNSVKFETLEEGKAEAGHDQNQTILEKELTTAHADLNLLHSLASAAVYASSSPGHSPSPPATVTTRSARPAPPSYLTAPPAPSPCTKKAHPC